MSLEKACSALSLFLSRFCPVSEVSYNTLNLYISAFIGSVIRAENKACLMGHVAFNVPFIEKEDKYFDWAWDLHRFRYRPRPAKVQVVLIPLWFVDISAHLKQIDDLRKTNWKKAEKEYGLTVSDGHQLVGILDHEEQTFRLYDPTGSHSNYAHLLPVMGDFILRKWNLDKSYHVSPLEEHCPRIGMQTITRDNFCVLWSLLIIYLVMACQTSDHAVIHLLSKWSPTKLTRLLEGFHCYVWEYLHFTDIPRLDHILKTHPQMQKDTALRVAFYNGDLQTVRAKMRKYEKTN